MTIKFGCMWTSTCITFLIWVNVVLYAAKQGSYNNVVQEINNPKTFDFTLDCQFGNIEISLLFESNNVLWYNKPWWRPYVIIMMETLSMHVMNWFDARL